jgi:hypothetical protein
LPTTSYAKNHDLLFQIDARPIVAALRQAKGKLAKRVRGSGTGCLSLLMPDLAGRDFVWFRIEPQSESDHQGVPVVYQAPCDD